MDSENHAAVWAMISHARTCAFVAGRGLAGLAFDAKVHDVVAADGAVVDHDI